MVSTLEQLCPAVSPSSTALGSGWACSRSRGCGWRTWVPDHGEQSGGGSSPTIDRAVEREFNALRDFLAQLEQGGSPRTRFPTAGQTPTPARTEPGRRAERSAGQANGAGESPIQMPQRPEPEPVLYWW